MNTVQAGLTQRAQRTGNRIGLPSSVNLRLGDFVRQTAARTGDDHLSTFAGNLAYRNLFAIFPSLVSLFWVLKLFGASWLLRWVTDLVTTALPKSAGEAMKQQLTAVSGAQAGGTLTVGAIVALLVAVLAISAACQAAMQALNAVHGVDERRPFVRRQAIALLLALAVSALLAGALAVLVFGSRIASQLSGVRESGTLLRWLWFAGSWPVIGAGVLAAFALVYYLAPDVEQKFRFISIGSVIGAALWLLFAALFSLYINNVIAPTQTYGALAGVAVLMVYLYISSFILLLGAEMNRVIEQHDLTASRSYGDAGSALYGK
jgi:membrane protein